MNNIPLKVHKGNEGKECEESGGDIKLIYNTEMEFLHEES